MRILHIHVPVTVRTCRAQDCFLLVIPPLVRLVQPDKNDN